MSNYTLVDIQSSPYSSIRDIERELKYWKERDTGEDEGIKMAIEQLEALLNARTHP